MKGDDANDLIDIGTGEVVTVDKLGTTHLVDIGMRDVVIIDKLYGPTMARRLRIRLNWEPWQWVIERDDSTADADGNRVECWAEVARFAADLDDE